MNSSRKTRWCGVAIFGNLIVGALDAQNTIEADSEAVIQLVERWASTPVTGVMESVGWVVSGGQPSDLPGYWQYIIPHLEKRATVVARHLETHCRGKLASQSQLLVDGKCINGYAQYYDGTGSLLVDPLQSEVVFVNHYHGGLCAGFRPHIFLGIRAGVSLAAALRLAERKRQLRIAANGDRLVLRCPYGATVISIALALPDGKLMELSVETDAGIRRTHITCSSWDNKTPPLPVLARIERAVDDQGRLLISEDIRLSWSHDILLARQSVVDYGLSMPIVIGPNQQLSVSEAGADILLQRHLARLTGSFGHLFYDRMRRESNCRQPKDAVRWPALEASRTISIGAEDWSDIDQLQLNSKRLERHQLDESYCGHVALSTLLGLQPHVSSSSFSALYAVMPNGHVDLGSIVRIAAQNGLHLEPHVIESGTAMSLRDPFLYVPSDRPVGREQVGHLALGIPLTFDRILVSRSFGDAKLYDPRRQEAWNVLALVTDRDRDRLRVADRNRKLLFALLAVAGVITAIILWKVARGGRGSAARQSFLIWLIAMPWLQGCSDHCDAVEEVTLLEATASTSEVFFTSFTDVELVDLIVRNNSAKAASVAVEAPACACISVDKSECTVAGHSTSMIKMTVTPKVVGAYEQRVVVRDTKSGAKVSVTITMNLGKGIFVTPTLFTTRLSKAKPLSGDVLKVVVLRDLGLTISPIRVTADMPGIDALITSQETTQRGRKHVDVYTVALAAGLGVATGSYGIEINVLRDVAGETQHAVANGFFGYWME